MKKALIVVGLGYGDESKGSTVDFLTKEYKSDLTVRFSGGPQCGHNVIDEKGNHHTFSQFGSGTLAGAKTLLGKNVLINPLSLMVEAEKLKGLIGNIENKIFVDENAVIVTPFHVKVNRLREMERGKAKHGSCGHGVWETLSDSLKNPATCLRVADLKHRATTEYKLTEILIRCASIAKELKLSEPWENEIFDIFRIPFKNIYYHYDNFLKTVQILTTEQVASLINKSEYPIFEGNQGIGLDDKFGFFPFITANDTTSNGAIKMMENLSLDPSTREVFGVMRCYMTRHGAGPFITEDETLSMTLRDANNPHNPWQDNMRFGWLDTNLLNYTIICDENINSLVVSHLDDLEKVNEWKFCYKYKKNSIGYYLSRMFAPNEANMQQLGQSILESKPVYCTVEKENIIKGIQQSLELPVSIISNGPQRNNRKFYKEYDYLS